MPGKIHERPFRVSSLILKILEHAPHLLDAKIALLNDLEAKARKRAGHKRRIVCWGRRTTSTSNRVVDPSGT